MNKLLPNFESALTQLIASPSISSNLAEWDHGNREVIDLLASWFETLGFSITIQPVPNTRNKFNMLAQLGTGEGGLLLAGHSDTVPFDDNRWQSDPLNVTKQDDKFFGLGTCDMKGFFAFILQVARQVDAKQLKKPLYVLATADEETTMAGARFFAEQQLIKPDVAIIGEPTELVPVVMHKGHMSHRISVAGQSGHSSKPALGVNAIEIIHQIIGQLLALKQDLCSKYQNQAFDVPEPTLNLGAISGGDNANRICGHCNLDIDMRALPGLKDEELVHWLSEALKPIAEQYPGRITMEELHPPCPSFGQADSHGLLTVAEEISGHQCCAVNYCTEAPYIQSLGCDTIVLGPGSINQAHQPDEFLAYDQIDETLRVLTAMIQRYCMQD
ncbi:acetylornithine deacetylase [Thalassotalea euphylliae]|uniref:Acetylornithine deacetylase n=1 Tax=Thalassotalea euphylliae TaxID=1655234 RepID=A0A3E0TXD7_9GAMM|nr:acetylornithine deacetylase [Thalassotalea euphylliae]REL29037.1 acetylornithine deacetylase [Thalassotalea euphylliae]